MNKLNHKISKIQAITDSIIKLCFGTSVSALSVIISTISVFGASIQQANAYDVTLEQALNFGTIVVISNDAAGELAIDRFGNVSASNEFRIISSGQPAVFSITGLPPFSGLNVLVTEVGAQMNPGRPFTETFTFEVHSFDPTARADSLGNATVRVGGKIILSGNGPTTFEDAAYASSFRIGIDF